MLYFKIGFENGDSFETGFNGTLDEARRYYLGHVFNLGAVDDDMQRCNSVEQRRIPEQRDCGDDWNL